MSATGELLQDPQQILLRVFAQLQANPDLLPDLPIEDFAPGSEERRLLEGFMALLLRMREGEQTLRASQQRYEDLVNSLDGIVWEGQATEWNMTFTFVSLQAERILGYPREQWYTEAQFWHNHVYAEDRGWATAYSDAAVRDLRPHQFEYRMVAADGRIVWMREIVSVSQRPEGGARLRGVTIDVTESREQEQHYRSIFEATSDALIINDIDGRVVEVNPAFCKMHGYTYAEALGLDPRQFIHPSSHYLFEEFLEVMRNGGVFIKQAMDVRKDGTPFHVEVHGSRVLYHGKLHSLAVVRDITTRVQAYELMEQRVIERTAELSALLDISRNMAAKLELRPLLKGIVNQVRRIVDYSHAAITIIDGQEALIWQLRPRADGAMEEVSFRMPVAQAAALWSLVKQGQPIVIASVHDNNRLARAYRSATSASARVQANTDPPADVVAWMGVPIMMQDRVLGMLSLSHPQRGFYTARHAELVLAVANQAGIAIENARLFEQTQETARAAAAQAEIASRVALGGPLDSTLDEIGEHIGRATGAVASMLALRQSDSGQMRVISTHGLPPGYGPAMNEVLSSGTRLLAEEAFSGRQPLIVRNMRQRIASIPAYEPLHHYTDEVDWDTIVAVPMIYEDKPVGVLITYYPAEQELGATELSFHRVIANQAAVAVENARLLAEVQSRAAQEQRQHLARELHDSVSQALFSINLTARSIEIMLKRENMGNEAINGALGDLRQLTGGAMAEMRALIFELRPGALEEEGLVAALRKHAAAIQGRERIAVDVIATPEGDVPRLKPAAEEALYRIAQEALHNVVKHARASAVRVTIGVEPDDPQHFTLRVADNGVGFDPTAVPPGHLGLGTMGQRATALGASYAVTSKPGIGTTVVVHVPLEKWLLDE